MTPEQKLKHAVLLKHFSWGNEQPPEPITAENVDRMYDETEDADGEGLGLQDARSETRGGQVKTGLPAPYSRHYEAEEVAAKMPDGSWVGWTHWYGGGKHGEPEAIDWIEGAYDLTCVEEEKLVAVRTFTKAEQPA